MIWGKVHQLCRNRIQMRILDKSAIYIESITKYNVGTK